MMYPYVHVCLHNFAILIKIKSKNQKVKVHKCQKIGLIIIDLSGDLKGQLQGHTAMLAARQERGK